MVSRKCILAQKARLQFCFAAIIVAAGTLVQVSAYTGGEISIKLNNTQFSRLNNTCNYQIKVFVDYSVTDPTLIGQKINAVMKVYSSNGSLLKTTSFPAGFSVNKTGATHLLTNMPLSPAQNITTETVFTDLNKTNLLSNPVKTTPHMTDLIKSSEITPTLTD
jgi:hypothetical protein